MHASTIRVILNLQTGNVSLQYHVIYDDFYETVHSNEDEPPAEWHELFTLNRFNIEYEDEGYIPELANKWKSPEELQAQQQAKAAQRQQFPRPSTQEQVQEQREQDMQ